jgi:hypothetical protein
MAFQNVGFEDESAAALGMPDIWTATIVSAGMRAAGYDDGAAAAAGNTPAEAFEGGFFSNEDFLFAYAQPQDPLELNQAQYDTGTPEGVEDFEEEWNNFPFLLAWGSGAAASYDVGVPQDFEDFEEEWFSNESFWVDWAAIVAGPGEDTADYDGGVEPHEDFEEQWDFNHLFYFTMPATAPAQYDAGGVGQFFEDFEETLTPFTVTATVAGSILTKTGHTLSNGETVTLTNTLGELPNGLNEGYTYFVVGAAANTFQLAATLGGAAIAFTTTGVGIHTVTGDPTIYWVDVMTTI